MSETLAAVRAETTKLRGIRGTRISLLLFAAVSVLIAALDGWSAKNALESDNPSLRSDFTRNRPVSTASSTASWR